METSPDRKASAPPEISSDPRNTSVINKSDTESLLCYYQNALGQWQTREFSPRRKRILIGSDPYEAHIKLDNVHIESIHCVAQKLKDFWIILETARSKAMEVNGSRSRQAKIRPGEKCAIKLGNTPMVFSCGFNEELSLSSSKKSTSTLLDFSGSPIPFEQGRTLILGANSIADIDLAKVMPDHAKEPENNSFFKQQFLAGIRNCGNILFMFQLNSAFPLSINGKSAQYEAVPLKSQNEVVFDNLSFTLNIPPEFKEAPENIYPPNLTTRGFVFLLLDDDGNVTEEIELPPEGSSAFLGRSSKKSQIVIPSKEISRQHMQMIIYENNIVIEDCFSSNGTYVNDEKIRKARIRPGDTVSAGHCRLLLCYGE